MAALRLPCVHNRGSATWMLSTAAISKPRFPGWDSDGCVWIKHLPLFQASGARWVRGCKRAQATPRGPRLAVSESERRGQVILKDQRILMHRTSFRALAICLLLGVPQDHTLPPGSSLCESLQGRVNQSLSLSPGLADC